jgi:Asp-tRNA(Asn)/Glu-tRNA(Gln) amidotransferase A subunit family amidase
MDPDPIASLPAGRAATLIADGTLSPVDLLEACLARAGAAVEDVKRPASFAASREMIACFAGVPACSLPSGVSSLGLPHAVQLVAAAARDAELLAVAARCERVLDFKLSPSM